jgi:hypothetical protein
MERKNIGFRRCLNILHGGDEELEDIQCDVKTKEELCRKQKEPRGSHHER